MKIKGGEAESYISEIEVNFCHLRAHLKCAG